MLFLLFAALANAAEPPAVYKVGTLASGSNLYLVSSTMHKFISESSNVRLQSITLPGVKGSVPKTLSSEIHFFLSNATDMQLHYLGDKVKVDGKNPYPRTPQLRLVLRGAPTSVGLLVRKASDLRNISQIRGKRLTSGYTEHPAIQNNIVGFINLAGLSWKDINLVPVKTLDDGLKALVEGRADIATYAPTAPRIKDVDKQVGLRFLELDCSPPAEARMKKAIPSYYFVKAKAGSIPGLEDDSCLISYDAYFMSASNIPNDAVASVLRQYLKVADKIAGSSQQLTLWNKDRAVDPNPTVPYHEGAVIALKEAGLWTAELEQKQKSLLEQQ